MRIKFTEQEIKDIIGIIEEYRSVSKELYVHQDKAKEIQEKVTELEGTLKSIKEKEDSMMSELHSKYGEFGIQDVYDSIYDRGL